MQDHAKVFLCYSHVDYKAVRSLYTRLKRDRIAVWLDKVDLSPGQDWVRVIRDAILQSDMVLVCLSKEFNKQHGYRHQELKIALRKARSLCEDEVFILPIRLEECAMPESLRHLHRLDLFERGGYGRLIRALKGSESK